MQWMAGEGGIDADMTKEGALAEALVDLWKSPETRKTLGRNAREHAERMFSKDVVIGQYIEYYERVIGG